MNGTYESVDDLPVRRVLDVEEAVVVVPTFLEYAHVLDLRGERAAAELRPPYFHDVVHGDGELCGVHGSWETGGEVHRGIGGGMRGCLEGFRRLGKCSRQRERL